VHGKKLYKGRLTIKPQTFCGLKEIELKTIKIQQRTQQCITIMQSRITNKVLLLWRVDGLINFEEPFSGIEELSFNSMSYSAKNDYV